MRSVTPAKEGRLFAPLLAVGLLFFAPATTAVGDDLPKPVQQVLAQFDKEVAEQLERAAARVRLVTEGEIKRKTQAGDLDGALALKQVLTHFEQRLKDLSGATTPAASPVGKWHRPDGRVYIIEEGGKGIIVRGNEGTEPLEWRAVGAKFRITFPTLPNTVNHIWPENDGSWSYAWENPDQAAGSLSRLD